MPRKAKPTKHSTKELNKRRKLATQDRGGGKKGRDARGGGKTGGARYQCYVCKKFIPDEKTMTIHFESKHSKLTLDMVKCMIIDVKKDHDAKRERIANQGPMLSAGKKMQRRAKKELKGKMKTAKPVVAKNKKKADVGAKPVDIIPPPPKPQTTEPSMASIDGSETPKKKKKKKKKKKDKENSGSDEVPKKKKKKKKSKDEKNGVKVSNCVTIDSNVKGGKTSKDKTKDKTQKTPVDILPDASKI